MAVVIGFMAALLGAVSGLAVLIIAFPWTGAVATGVLAVVSAWVIAGDFVE